VSLGWEKKRESWAGLETGKEERERLRVLFFLLKPFFKTFSNFKLKHFFNFSNFKTFQTLFFKFSNYFKVF
jgi:hypothetical protein